ncbi:MAG: DUF2309 domain-containing protein, partial [Gemmatimonadaceae bacterium]
WSRTPVGSVMESLTTRIASPARITLMTDVVDATRPEHSVPTWNAFTVDQISRCCAAYFDEGQASWQPECNDGLLRLWQHIAARDYRPSIVMRQRGFRLRVGTLSDSPEQLIADALAELQVTECDWAMYCTALLMSVNGWAAACAYRRWTAALESRTDDLLVDLLAIRMAWEVFLFRSSAGSVRADWTAAKVGWRGATAVHARDRQSWHLQRALEFAYQLPLARKLSMGMSRVRAQSVVAVESHFVFCIDVRSEPFRRALESVAPAVQTLGFAGFFGAPIEYRSVAGVARPQLPGLLASRMVVEDAGDDSARALAKGALDNPFLRVTTLLKSFATGFPFIEMSGVLTLPKLLRDSLGATEKTADPARAGADGLLQSRLKPRISGDANGRVLDVEARVSLAAGLLRGMSLTGNFAPLLVLVAHTSSRCNNPQAASLACGACGGQSGEVNARVMAALLNEPAVRRGLRASGIDLPDTTHVAAAVHDTTTDVVTLYDADEVPASHAERWCDIRSQLQGAGNEVRRRRAATLRITSATPAALQVAFQDRATNWSEVRPEWGLARNAAFIVAPRVRTAGIDLEGRAFLHEYRHDLDAHDAVLEAIMTAPMLVTHWINMQYYASTVDNLRYGSGDKTLHNVVGANVGVLEGASGDLRTGLALQSVHDGETWYHEPLRLSVFIEAPADAIDGVMQRHAVVRQLVEGEWLHLFRIDSNTGTVSLRTATGWQATVDCE